MPQEQINILLDGQKELRKDIETMRNEMHTEHKQLGERVTGLEHSAKITRWVFGFTGGMIMLIAREIVPLIF